MVKVKDVERMEKHEQYFERVLPEVLPAVQRIQHRLRSKLAVEIVVSEHSRYREFKREISYRAILETLRWGKVIEYQGSKDKREELAEFRDRERSDEPCFNVILMKEVYNNGKRHYLHVCINIQGNSIVIKTIYDPKSMYWQWTDSYSKRVFYKEAETRCPNRTRIPNSETKARDCRKERETETVIVGYHSS